MCYLGTKTDTQSNRTEKTEISLCLCGQLVYNKEAKNI